MNGCVLYLDASTPGDDPCNYWAPVFGPVGGGEICDITDPAMGVGHKPRLQRDVVAVDAHGRPDRFVWYYHFTANAPDPGGAHAGGGGLIGDLGDEVVFDYTDSFTVEIWFRYAEFAPRNDYARCWLFSVDNNHGYRYSLRKAVPTSQPQDLRYKFELVHMGSGTAYDATPCCFEISDQWRHAVMVHEGSGGGSFPNMKLYVDNVDVWDSPGVCRVTCPPDWATVSYLPDPYVISPAGVGGKDYSRSRTSYSAQERYWYRGDISVVRVYDRVLSELEVEQNYHCGIVSPVQEICPDIRGDLNRDCAVDLADVSIMAGQWLGHLWTD